MDLRTSGISDNVLRFKAIPIIRSGICHRDIPFPIPTFTVGTSSPRTTTGSRLKLCHATPNRYQREFAFRLRDIADPHSFRENSAIPGPIANTPSPCIGCGADPDPDPCNKPEPCYYDEDNQIFLLDFKYDETGRKKRNGYRRRRLNRMARHTQN